MFRYLDGSLIGEVKLYTINEVHIAETLDLGTQLSSKNSVKEVLEYIKNYKPSEDELKKLKHNSFDWTSGLGEALENDIKQKPSCLIKRNKLIELSQIDTYKPSEDWQKAETPFNWTLFELTDEGIEDFYTNDVVVSAHSQNGNYNLLNIGNPEVYDSLKNRIFYGSDKWGHLDKAGTKLWGFDAWKAQIANQMVT